MRYRLLASYQGAPYEAGLGPDDAGVVLFAACPPPEDLHFEPATGHWRKKVSRTDVQMLYESRPVGTFRGERCVVLDDLTDRLHIAYLGHDAYRAEQLGYWEVERGVFELITPRQEVTDIVEQRLPLDLQGEGGSRAGSDALGQPIGYGPPSANGAGPVPQFVPAGLGAGEPDLPGAPDQSRVSIPAVDEPPLPLEAEAMRAATAAARRSKKSQPKHGAGTPPATSSAEAAGPAAGSAGRPAEGPAGGLPAAPGAGPAGGPAAGPADERAAGLAEPVPVSAPAAAAIPVTPAGLSEPSGAVSHGGDTSAVPSWTPHAHVPPPRRSQATARPAAEAPPAPAGVAPAVQAPPAAQPMSQVPAPVQAPAAARAPAAPPAQSAPQAQTVARPLTVAPAPAAPPGQAASKTPQAMTPAPSGPQARPGPQAPSEPQATLAPQAHVSPQATPAPQAQAAPQPQAPSVADSAPIHGVPLPMPADPARQSPVPPSADRRAQEPTRADRAGSGRSSVPQPGEPAKPAPGGTVNGVAHDGAAAARALLESAHPATYMLDQLELPLPTTAGSAASAQAGSSPDSPAEFRRDERPLGAEAARRAAQPAGADIHAAPAHASATVTAPAPAEPEAQPTPRRRRASRRRLPTQRIFSDLAAQAGIPANAYAIGEDVEGAMCLVSTGEGFEVFNSLAGARHEVRVFQDEESAYFYLFGVLAAEAVRTGVLAPRP